MKQHDLIVIGGGPAGLAAAISARENGIEDIIILERDEELGGILNQCIHNGFGLHTFNEELTGPEYAARFIEKVEQRKIPYALHTMVADIRPKDEGYDVMTSSKETGLEILHTKAIVLAMGCRERPRGALNIPGYRPAGIFSAGTAQRLINIEGYLPGKEVVILGSGDIGLIMARRLTLEGAHVQCVAELMPYSGGLKRNIAQCLDDYGIPLKLSHTVVDIQGKERVEGVTIAAVDGKGKVIEGSEEILACDTLLLSVGLLPENELTRQAGIAINPITNGAFVNESMETSLEGIFACGNVLHVHDLVDYVSEEAVQAGKQAAKYILKGKKADRVSISLEAKDGVRYTVPSTINLENMEDTLTVRFRVGKPYRNAVLGIYYDEKCVQKLKKKVMSPGEMEKIILKKKDLEKDCPKTITLRIE